MKKLLPATALFLCAVLVFGYIAFFDDPTTNRYLAEHSSQASGKIAVLMPDKNTERWANDGECLRRDLEAAGYDVTLVFADADSTKQNNDIENFIAEGVDLMIVAAVDGYALSESLNAAVEKGIKIISYDRLIMNTDAVSYYVSFDNFRVGELIGEYIVDEFELDKDGAHINAEIFCGDSADNNATYFNNGQMSVLRPYIDSGVISILSGQVEFEQTSTAGWSLDVAFSRAQNLISSYYTGGVQLDAVIADADVLTMGVLQALENDYRGSNSVLVTGQDGEEAVLDAIVDGKNVMTIYKYVNNLAVVTRDLAIALLSGKDCGDDFASTFDFECKYDTVQYNNGVIDVPSFILEPLVITKDNYKEILVDSGWFAENEDGHIRYVK